jgi:hypothetical protein
VTVTCTVADGQVLEHGKEAGLGELVHVLAEYGQGLGIRASDCPCAALCRFGGTMRYPTAEEVAQVNYELTGDWLVRDPGLLASAVGRPQASFGARRHTRRYG